MIKGGEEHIKNDELADRLSQLRAANELLAKGVITDIVRKRAHNKIVTGLGDEIAGKYCDTPGKRRR